MDLNGMAEGILFGSIVESDILKTWEYRNNKSIESIRAAAIKALKPKNGNCKMENEISMLAVYLNDILKRKKMKN